MNPVSQVVVLVGVGIIVLASVGMLRLRTPYARIHAAGKASPVAFLVITAGTVGEVGGGGAAALLVACAALVLTLPLAVHLLFRALHASAPEHDPTVDELRAATHRRDR